MRVDVFGHDLDRQQHAPATFHVLIDVTGRTLFNSAPGDDKLKAYLDGRHVKWPSQEVLEREQEGRHVRQYVMTPHGLYLALGVPLRVQLNEKLPTHSYFAGFRIDNTWLREQLLSGSETESWTTPC